MRKIGESPDERCKSEAPYFILRDSRSLRFIVIVPLLREYMDYHVINPRCAINNIVIRRITANMWLVRCST